MPVFAIVVVRRDCFLNASRIEIIVHRDARCSEFKVAIARDEQRMFARVHGARLIVQCIARERDFLNEIFLRASEFLLTISARLATLLQACSDIKSMHALTKESIAGSCVGRLAIRGANQGTNDTREEQLFRCVDGVVDGRSPMSALA